MKKVGKEQNKIQHRKEKTKLLKERESEKKWERKRNRERKRGRERERERERAISAVHNFRFTLPIMFSYVIRTQHM